MDLASIFASDGVLAQHLKGYQARPSQLQLVQKIDDVLRENRILLAEAGTGTGKTFAYLLPALLSGKKSLVSTASKNLQEQIFNIDLPFVKKILGASARVALLKGRNNYLCHYHYYKYLEESPLINHESHYRRQVEYFFKTTKDGDLVGVRNVPEHAEILRKISSTTDNCLARDCAFFEECFLQKARKKAQEADLLVVNHHLLLADIALKNDGFAEILPEIEAFFIDEAHHLPKIAMNFFGTRLSSRQLYLFQEDLAKALAEDAPDATELINLLSKIKSYVQEILSTLSIKNKAHEERFILDGDLLLQKKEFWQAYAGLLDYLAELDTLLAFHYERSVALTKLKDRLGELRNIALSYFSAYESGVLYDLQKAQALWLDYGERYFMLNSVPVLAGRELAKLASKSAVPWCFLSATLTVNQSFDHFRYELGFGDNVETILVDSPFEYRKQALLYQPKNMPNPNESGFTRRLVDEALPLLRESKGRAFMLFTSYRAMHEAADFLQNEEFHLFVQGDASKSQLLEEFRRSDKGVLLATSSFWEGVDVRGDRLVCVVIDKLPFSSPNDPISKMIHLILKEKGLSPFMQDVLPQAVIALKQGVGRLIRSHDDYGVLMIADPRLLHKSYGKVFLDSLPRMTRCQDFSVVKRFFAFHE